jgi:putative oxidoreductase
MTYIRKLLATDAPAAVILIRLMVGAVFLSEGIQKFLYSESLGVGRFAKIGIPSPDVMAPFVGVVEVVCGSLVLVGLGTRLAAVPLLITISVAVLSTKVPILLGHGFWGFEPPKLDRYGFWATAHEARTDFSMWLGLAYLLVVGGGRWSLDGRAVRGSMTARPSA